MPAPANPTANALRSGANAPAAITGEGIQMQAPPIPHRNMAIARGVTPEDTAARLKPVVENISPIRIIVKSFSLLVAAATRTVPTRYAPTFIVDSDPAMVLDTCRSSLTAGSRTP